MPFTGFLSGHCLLATTFAWRSSTTGGTITLSLVYCVENVFPVFWYTLPPCHKICYRQKYCCLCVIKHRCVRSYSYVPILLAREYKPCRFARTRIIPPSRPRGRSHSQCCCVTFSGAEIVITTTSSSFKPCMCALATSISMYVRVPTEIQ